jgi:hypothetical protein
MHGFGGSLGARGDLGGKFIEGMEHGAVDGSSIVEEFSSYFLE